VAKRIGHITRGKTALNRLRQVDVYIALAWASALQAKNPVVVDVGYGAQAWTALEMWQRWQAVAPHLRLIGIEIDPERVANAQIHHHPPDVQFVLGGFNVLDVLGDQRASVIRAYNVLRQYDESAVQTALYTMAQGLATDGILLEGTSNPSGRMVVFDVYQRDAHGALQHRELVFGTNFRQALLPIDFQTILPKRLIHHAWDDRPKAFFADWERAMAIAKGMGLRSHLQIWTQAITHLHQKGYPIVTNPRLIRRGYLVLRDTFL
jgi:hypothetical protein